MKVELKFIRDYWQDVKDATMNTINKNTGKYPESSWKRRLFYAT